MYAQSWSFMRGSALYYVYANMVQYGVLIVFKCEGVANYRWNLM